MEKNRKSVMDFSNEEKISKFVKRIKISAFFIHEQMSLIFYVLH